MMWGRRSPLDVEVAAHVPDEDLAVPPALHPAARRRDQLRGIVPFVGHAAGDDAAVRGPRLRRQHDLVERQDRRRADLDPLGGDGVGDLEAGGAVLVDDRDLHDDVWRPPSDLNALSPSLRSGSGDGFPLRWRRLPREVRHEQVPDHHPERLRVRRHRAGVDHGDDLENAGDAERFQRGATEVVLDLVDRGHWS